jgi:hypothetical protein
LETNKIIPASPFRYGILDASPTTMEPWRIAEMECVVPEASLLHFDLWTLTGGSQSNGTGPKYCAPPSDSSNWAFLQREGSSGFALVFTVDASPTVSRATETASSMPAVLDGILRSISVIDGSSGHSWIERLPESLKI